ncbi:MAG: TetR/AcrR family transcriptional regulator [Cyclobacteriaceae bacterium]|jgi:AcrR family transcriptional regulator|nr:TetR/AcrR family transcriptional regulator; helix-turn-helix transcriptional regulator [Flammeovirgaceae bacterium]
MNDAIKLPWVEAGYHLFAEHGPKGLKVEVIARHVNKSKSSFYHHFSDLEVFTEELLFFHMHRAKQVAELERACKTIVPELLNVLVDAKTDLLFNRQLRIHRDTPAFKKCFEQSNELASQALMNLWATELGLADNQKLAGLLFKLVMDNFYLQISERNLTYPWLLNYFAELGTMVEEMKKAEATY